MTEKITTIRCSGVPVPGTQSNNAQGVAVVECDMCHALVPMISPFTLGRHERPVGEEEAAVLLRHRKAAARRAAEEEARRSDNSGGNGYMPLPWKYRNER